MTTYIDELNAAAMGCSVEEAKRRIARHEAMKAEVDAAVLPKWWHRYGERSAGVEQGVRSTWVRVQAEGEKWRWLGWIPPNRGPMDAGGEADTFAEAVATAEKWRVSR